ncbi:MAG: hypothetical protein J6M93_00950 [Succinivibrio sp.]|nr:hypothetical protein [Succinivibrio sp.]
MYTLSGAAIAEGMAAAPAKIITGSHNENSAVETNSSDPQTEIDFFYKKNREFADRLREIGSPAPDRIRDVFGAAAGYLTNSNNLNEIVALIQKGSSCTMACRSVFLSNLHKFSKTGSADDEEDNKQIYSLVIEFISSLHSLEEAIVDVPELNAPCVVVAKDLSPALFLSLRTDLVKAVILEGGRTSGHLSIVLRELGIPSIFGVLGATSIKQQSPVLVDANNGVVVVDPPEATTTSLLEKHDFLDKFDDDDSLLNVTISCSVGAVRQSGDNHIYRHHGLGLLRSEFLFLSSDHEPTEEEMTKSFAEVFSPIDQTAPVTARTFDFANDKKPRFTLNYDESGPLKGYGACVGTRLLKKELRALLKACPERKITIVFPLVTRVSESKYLHNLATECEQELEKEKVPHSAYEIALMIETPAAVLSARAFADHCSMFIIGTSSLAEYAAAPRPTDVAFTPALAKMLMMAAKAAHDAGVPIGIAGQYAPRIELMPFFFSMGTTYITVDTYQVAKLRLAVERLNIDDIKPCFDEGLYHKIMNLFTGQELACLINQLNLRE